MFAAYLIAQHSTLFITDRGICVITVGFIDGFNAVTVFNFYFIFSIAQVNGCGFKPVVNAQLQTKVQHTGQFYLMLSAFNVVITVQRRQ